MKTTSVLLIAFMSILFLLRTPSTTHAQNSQYNIIAWDSFELFTHSGQKLSRDLSEFRASLPQPDEETQRWDEFFGTYVCLIYGQSEFDFVKLYTYNYYFFRLKDPLFFVRLNGVEIRIGNHIQGVAEHFPKSWTSRRESNIYPGWSSIYFPVGDSGIEVFYDTLTGAINEIHFDSPLT